MTREVRRHAQRRGADGGGAVVTTPPERPPRPNLEAIINAPLAYGDVFARSKETARYALHLEAQLAEHEAAWEAMLSPDAVEAGVNAYVVADDQGATLKSRVRRVVVAARTAARGAR